MITWFWRQFFQCFPAPLGVKPLPSSLQLPVLKSRVRVALDDGGIPHIKADGFHDLFAAQGYLMARDRLFQMDFIRRAVSGRLAEILGDQPLNWKALTYLLKGRTLADADFLSRCFNLRSAAEKSLPLLDDFARLALTAFCQGVNTAREREPPPLECVLLRYRLEPWTPLDSLLVVKGIAIELNYAWRPALLRGWWREKYGDFAAGGASLSAAYGPEQAPLLKWSNGTHGLELEEAWRRFAGFSGPHLGSNNWAIAGHRTGTGKPLVCNDPHLTLGAPAPWWACHLQCGDYNVAGVTPPGLPGVAIGHNERLAWAITAGLIQDTDCFVEELSPDGAPKYLFQGAWLPLETREELIYVRGRREPLKRTLRLSRHGPLLSDALDNAAPGKALAMCWTAHEPSGDLNALLLIDRAANFQDFHRALAHHGSPAFNLVYADTAGHIGYQFAGLVPIRKSGRNEEPAPGKDGAHDWIGFVPYAELPSLYDPPQGFIATANNKLVDDAYPHFFGNLWEPPYRYRRICELIEAQPRLDREDCRRIQLDVYSRWGHQLARQIAAAVPAGSLTGAGEKASLEILAAWDGQTTTESQGAAVLHALCLVIGEKAIGGQNGAEAQALLWDLGNLTVLPLERLVTNELQAWLDGTRSPEQIREIFRAAVELLAARTCQAPQKWRWGSLHRTSMRHRLEASPIIRRIFNLGPIPGWGDSTTVNNATFRYNEPFDTQVGPSMRLIMDLSDWDATRFCLCTGQSGHPLSPRYQDHFQRWQNGEYFGFPFTTAALSGLPVMHLEPQK